ncbi:hypothetical protein Ancab_006605 [Ancistrocladus abbreviatus]
MPTKARNLGRQHEHCEQNHQQPGLYTQPWWHGLTNNGISPAVPSECTSRSSSEEEMNGPVFAGSFQLQTSGVQNGGATVRKESQSSLAVQSVDGSNGQEGQQIKQVPTSMPPPLGEHLQANSQMELVGHSIVLTSYPFQDPTYGGMLASYAQQVNPHLYGLHQTRMPLPLAMEEEPVYVNAKQYHGILRRRQSRAKAELEKKVIRGRKPYLHESRHLHALRRARGSGGRFLNKKKLDSSNATAGSDKDSNPGSSLPASSAGLTDAESYPVDSSRNRDSSCKYSQGGMTVNGPQNGAVHLQREPTLSVI